MRGIISFLFACFFLFSTPAFSLDDPRDSGSPFGVLDFLAWDHDWNQHHYDADKVEKAVKMMKEAGVGFVRMDFLWDDIEPSYGDFRFEKYDRIVELLTQNHIGILGLLSYNSSWAASEWNAPPNKTFFTKYAKAVVHRYKDRVKYWEIWNEPDDAQYWRPQDEMKSYTELLKAVYPALKKEDPSCIVVLGGLSKTIAVSLRRIYKNGGKDYFDVVNFHPFTDPLLPNSLEFLESVYKGAFHVMEQKGDAEKPIWFSELGCPGVKSADSSNGWWLGRSPTELQQAEWVDKVYTNALSWKGVKKVFWAFFRDTPNYFKNGTDYFGLVRQDFSAKPSYEAYRLMASKSDQR